MIAGDEKAVAGSVRSGERGSALIIALLVMVMMTLLGVPFLLMGQIENHIAENERLSGQAAYAAESGAHMVKRWFDRPMASSNLINPPLAAIDFSQRKIDEDGDPGTVTVPADGTSTKPWYKDGNADVFQKPYGADLVNTLLGTEEGPDIVINRDSSTAARNFLIDLSQELFGSYPSGGYKARISLIEVYAPPHVEQGGAWTRFGVATAKVTAGIYREGGSDQPLAERMAKFVLNEVPYRTRELGALHSCGDLTWDQGFTAHWGVATAKDTANLGDHTQIPASLARLEPNSLWIDKLWNVDFGSYQDELYAANMVIDDPWLRFVSGQTLAGAPSGDQPWPFLWPGGTGTLGDLDGELPNHLGTGVDGSHSAYFQNKTVGCPQFPYETWKAIALRGGPGVHYYVWAQDLAPAQNKFRENGMDPALTFLEITDNQDGLFFFDTRDGLPPAADGSNLTPDITLTGGTWGARGFIYLNADVFQSHAAAGRPVEFRPPAEPFLDSDTDGEWDSGEKFINLEYPTALDGVGSDFKADGTTPVWDDRGPVIDDDANFWGVFYTSGSFDSRGTATYYGSVIAERGIDSISVATGTPDIYWDQSLHEDWPPADWGLPLVAVTHWETEL